MKGTCHICREEVDIKFCPGCKHWLCKGCWGKPVDRGVAAVVALYRRALYGKENCCGPDVAVEDKPGGTPQPAGGD